MMSSKWGTGYWRAKPRRDRVRMKSGWWEAVISGRGCARHSTLWGIPMGSWRADFLINACSKTRALRLPVLFSKMFAFQKKTKKKPKVQRHLKCSAAWASDSEWAQPAAHSLVEEVDRNNFKRFLHSVCAFWIFGGQSHRVCTVLLLLCICIANLRIFKVRCWWIKLGSTMSSIFQWHIWILFEQV